MSRKKLLHPSIIAEHDKVKDQGCGRRDHKKLVESQKFDRRADPDKFADNQAAVCDKDNSNSKDSPANAKTFPNEVQ